MTRRVDDDEAAMARLHREWGTDTPEGLARLEARMRELMLATIEAGFEDDEHDTGEGDAQ